MYMNGEGIIKNDKTAAKWFRQAAEQGNAPAQENLGVMYANGAGVVKNRQRGYMWLLLAKANSYDGKLGESASVIIRELEKALTPATQEAAQQEATKWQAKI